RGRPPEGAARGEEVRADRHPRDPDAPRSTTPNRGPRRSRAVERQQGDRLRGRRRRSRVQAREGEGARRPHPRREGVREAPRRLMAARAHPVIRGRVQEIVAGHWHLPRFNGDTLPDKPLLYHWLGALPCGAAGFSEAAVRLPSALAGAVLVGWTASFGTELGGPRVGVAAAVMLGTMPALFDHSRVARPDVLVTLLLSIALGLAFRWWRDESRAAATGALAV